MKKLILLILLLPTLAFAQATTPPKVTVTVVYNATAADIAAFAITGLQIERKPALCGTGTAPFVVIGNTGSATVKTFVDATVVAGGQYCYRAAAKGRVSTLEPLGLSAYSPVAEITVPMGPMPAPGSLQLTITFLDAMIKDLQNYKAALLSLPAE